MISLDGSFLEGGGQIVRTALALSTITRKSFKVNNIRKGRSTPGLKNQHLFCINAMEKLYGAKSKGAEIGSTELIYSPGEIKGHNITIDIGTAGSITLFLQSLLIPSIKMGSRLKVTGGTDVKWSPQFDYFNNVIIPQLKKYADIEVKLGKRGYYPKGGGNVIIKIKPKETDKIRSLNLIGQEKLIQIKGISHASFDLQQAKVAERQANTAKTILSKLNCPVSIQTEYSETLSTGSGITLWARFSRDDQTDFYDPIIVGSDYLGERGKKSEEIGRIAAESLIKEIQTKAPVDQHLADNLIPYLVIFGGKIKVSEITNHTLANIYVCEQFFEKKFEVDKNNNIISYIKPKPF